MAEQSELNVKMNFDCEDAIKGIKAFRRELNGTLKDVKELQAVMNNDGVNISSDNLTIVRPNGIPNIHDGEVSKDHSGFVTCSTDFSTVFKEVPGKMARYYILTIMAAVGDKTDTCLFNVLKDGVLLSCPADFVSNSKTGEYFRFVFDTKDFREPVSSIEVKFRAESEDELAKIRIVDSRYADEKPTMTHQYEF